MLTALVRATLLSQTPAPARLDLQLHGAPSAAPAGAMRLDTSETLQVMPSLMLSPDGAQAGLSGHF